jgi:hypothetical protein
MQTDRSVRPSPNRPATASLRVAFGLLWVTDLVATIFLFLVPYATELNPITIHLYRAIGLPGVLLAGVCYAALVVLTGHLLSKPMDRVFGVGIVSVYAVCVANNVVLLLFRKPIVETLLL